MRFLVLLTILNAVFPGVVFADQPDRAELLGSPKVIEGAVEPAFVDLTVEQLKQELMVVSSRSFAVFGFNNSEVQIHLPECDNSVYASVEFSPVSLTDSLGKDVPFELERGIYDHDSHSNEIRFTPVGDAKPVVFARARGTIALKYPLRMRTVAVSAGDTAPAGVTVSLDGPFVSWSDPGERLPKGANFTPVVQFRAFDASGLRLEQDPWKGFFMRGGITTETFAYWGEVAEIRIDVVEDWADVEISYSLPSIEPLPSERAGLAPEHDGVSPTPGGVVEVRVIGQEDPRVEMSKDQVLAELKELGFRHFDVNSFILAATRGRADAVRLFIAGGMPVDSESGGRTALMSAAMLGRVEAGKVLIEAGADVNKTDGTGSPALSRLVMQCGATELLRAFIDAGADLTVELGGGVTMSQMAKLAGCSDNERLLKEAGAHR